MFDLFKMLISSKAREATPLDRLGVFLEFDAQTVKGRETTAQHFNRFHRHLENSVFEA